MQNPVWEQVLAATQTPGEAGMKWFQGTADAVRKFIWLFEVGIGNYQLLMFGHPQKRTRKYGIQPG